MAVQTASVFYRLQQYIIHVSRHFYLTIVCDVAGRIRNSPEANEDTTDGDEDGALSLGLFPGERPTLDDRAVFR